MSSCSARSNSSRVSTPGSSSQSRKPPCGSVARVPAEVFGHQLAQPSHLFAVQPAHAVQVMLVAARLQIRSDRIAEQLWLAAGGLEFQQRDAFGEAAAIQPADAVIRRQRLGKASHDHHPAVAIEGFQQRGRWLAELQLGIHRILYQRQLACIDQLGQALLGGGRHGTAQRIVHGGHHHQCGQRRVLQHRLQRIDLQAVLRMGGQLDGLQAEVGQQRVQVEVGGRLDAHRVARFGHRAQGQLQGLHRTMGQQQALAVGMQPHARATPHDLRQQAWRAVRACVGLHRLLAMAQHLRGVTGQLRAWVELPTARAGEGQVDHARAALCLQHPRHEYLLQRCGRGRGTSRSDRSGTDNRGATSKPALGRGITRPASSSWR